MEATLFTTAGEETKVLPDGETFSLAELQKFVGGYIELVRLPEGMLLVVNEEHALGVFPPTRPLRSWLASPSWATWSGWTRGSSNRGGSTKDPDRVTPEDARWIAGISGEAHVSVLVSRTRSRGGGC